MVIMVSAIPGVVKVIVQVYYMICYFWWYTCQCVDQLLKSHQLFEKGVITKEQYEEFQASILSDVKKF